MKVCNAFSLQMMTKPTMLFRIEEVDFDLFLDMCVGTGGVDSYLGHQDLVNVLNKMVARLKNKDLVCSDEKREHYFEYHRGNLKIDPIEDIVIGVIQVVGGRLPEGTTELPEGTELKFYLVWSYDYPRYCFEK
jgi:hypothetical protein